MKWFFVAVIFMAAVALLIPFSASAYLGDHATDDPSIGDHCAICHNTQQSATLRGWGKDFTGVPTTGWYSRTITKLCWSCHNATGGGVGAHDVSATAMANGATIPEGGPPPVHMYSPGTVWSVDGVQAENYSATGLPYTLGGGLLECTTCHNVHNDAGAPFNNRPNIGGSDGLCAECHKRYNGPSSTSASAQLGDLNTVGAGSRSLHPTNMPIPVVGFDTLSPRLQVLLPPDIANVNKTWKLGGHLTSSQEGGSGCVSCQTCHAVHGTYADDDLVTVLINVEDLLAIPNNYNVAGQPSNLCEGCHGGPAGATIDDPATPVVEDSVGVPGTSDHPIDQVGGRLFHPDGVTLPASWTNNTDNDTAAAPFWNNGANPGAGSDAPVCSSCHDVHGGIGGTSLWRAPDNRAGIDHWCFNCHPISAVTPPYHHSNIWNDDDFTANPLCTVSPPASVLDCGHCHGVTGGGYWHAHNGFWDFINNVAISDTDSAICEECHTPENPTLLIAQGYDPASAGWPACHAPNNLGTDSHVVGATFGINNVVAFAGNWVSQASGNYAAPYDRLPIDAAFPAGVFSEWGAGGEVLCESCHDLLENCGTETGDPLGGGWKMNLLYLAYEDDNFGNLAGAEEICSWDTVQTGDRLCRICHNLDSDVPPDGIANGIGGVGTGTYVHYPGAHTIETYVYAPNPTPYGRPTDGIMTTPTDPTTTPPCPDVSTADNPTAPNNFSYPADNQINCDSCHRAHNAHTADAVAGGGVTGHVIMQDAAALPKADTCDQCHDTQIQCQ